MEQSSYRLREHFREQELELARLRAQAQQYWPKESAALVRHGLRPDARVLELGCGPGFLTELLLDLVPEGSVAAVDVDPDMVAFARERLAGRERVEVVEGSATKVPFDDDSFDAATARLLLQHLPDPSLALAELKRVLRPGGRVLVTDVDDAYGLLVEPEPSFVREFAGAMASRQRARGGDRHIGRRLPRLVRDAGFTDLRLEVIVLHSAVDGGDVRQVIGGPEVIDELERQQLVSAQAIADAREFVARYDRGEADVEIMLSLFVASGAA